MSMDVLRLLDYVLTNVPQKNYGGVKNVINLVQITVIVKAVVKQLANALDNAKILFNSGELHVKSFVLEIVTKMDVTK